jgi:hypothetical protein
MSQRLGQPRPMAKGGKMAIRLSVPNLLLGTLCVIDQMFCACVGKDLMNHVAKRPYSLRTTMGPHERMSRSDVTPETSS